MRPIDFRGSNITFNKPDNMTDEECVPLHAFKGQTETKHPVIITLWQPSKEDLDALNEGQPIHIQLTSQVMPPIAVFTVSKEGEVN